jgi:UDPglucose 6-dehydrogenase
VNHARSLHTTPTTPGTSSPSTQVVVLGTGYVGLTAAAGLAGLGHRVVGLDVDAAKVASLARGQVTIVEDGLPELVAEGLVSGRLRFAHVMMASGHHGLVAGEGAESLRTAEIVLLCLATPTAADGSLDTSTIEAAARAIGPLLAPRAVVVTKSTVPVGTHGLLATWLGRSDVAVVSNPEFLREGTAVHDFAHPDRVVVGGDDPDALDRVAALYASLDAPVLRMDAASAELVKVGANAFLATRLSFVNELSRLCERVGADISEVAAGVGADHRIGAAFFRPGPGWGGSCFPKDTKGLAHLAARVGVAMPVVDAAIASNEAQIRHVLTTIDAELGGSVRGRRIAVWGISFKAGTDDCRDSTSLRIVDALIEAGAEVVMTDPAARITHAGARTAADPMTASSGADAVLVATEWPEYADVPLDDVASVMAGDVVIDCRNVLVPAKAVNAGLRLVQLGRPALPASTVHVAAARMRGAA